MSIRRTRKQKETSNHSFLLSWKPDSRGQSGSLVKGQFKNEPNRSRSEANGNENANLLDKNTLSVHIKRDLTRSLVLASFILGLELMVYLAWK